MVHTRIMYHHYPNTSPHKSPHSFAHSGKFTQSQMVSHTLKLVRTDVKNIHIAHMYYPTVGTHFYVIVDISYTKKIINCRTIFDFSIATIIN